MTKETKILLGIIAAIVVGMIGIFTLFNKQGTTSQTDSQRLVRSDSQKQGSGSVQLVEFGDYQCPACGQAFPIIQRIMNEYNGKVQLVFRNYPLETIHKNALVAAYYAEAAGKQGKFWQMHDKLYETQDKWSDSADPKPAFEGYAKELGLDVSKLTSDAASSSVKTFIKRDQDDGNALNIQGTPAFYVNGKAIANFDYNSLKSAIDSALK